MNTAKRHDIGKDAARPVTSRLHPRVYALAIGFAGWFALAAWGFAGTGVTDYLLFIVSGFIFVVIVLTFFLSRVGRTSRATDRDPAEGDDKPLSFIDWAAADFAIWQDRLSGAQAAILILLPIAAAAIGMTAFAIVFHIAERGGA